MKIKTKIVLTILTTLIWSLLYKVLTPVSQLAANSTIVAQLEHSDSASLANSLVGNGSDFTQATLFCLYLGIVIFVWTRSNKGN